MKVLYQGTVQYKRRFCIKVQYSKNEGSVLSKIPTWFSPITCFYTLNIALMFRCWCWVRIAHLFQWWQTRNTLVWTPMFFLFVFYIIFVFLLYYVCESTHAYTYPHYKFIHVLALLPSFTGIEQPLYFRDFWITGSMTYFFN